jgi:hypothetical protein
LANQAWLDREKALERKNMTEELRTWMDELFADTARTLGYESRDEMHEFVSNLMV